MNELCCMLHACPMSATCPLLLFFDSEAQYMIILFMVFIVQFSVSSACLAVNREQQVRALVSPQSAEQHKWCSLNNSFFLHYNIFTSLHLFVLCCTLICYYLTLYPVQLDNSHFKKFHQSCWDAGRWRTWTSRQHRLVLPPDSLKQNSPCSFEKTPHMIYRFVQLVWE